MKKKVLVVEDDKDIQEYYEVVLSDFDLEFIWASDGQEALNFIDSKRDINLIILDLVMPVMGGEKFLHELRDQRNSRIPVIVSSVDDIAASRLDNKSLVQGIFFKLSKVDELRGLVRDNL